MRPQPSDYAPFFEKYVCLVPDGDIVELLVQAKADVTTLLQFLPPDKWDYRYAEGKWSIRELILHMIDTERIFSYRALRIARNDQTPLSGFEQDEYVPFSNANNRSWESLIQEYVAVREASIQLFKNFTPEMWQHTGTASSRNISVLALAFLTVGHEQHHLNVLKDKYLS